MKKIHIVLIAVLVSFLFRLKWLLLCPYAFIDVDTSTIGLMALHILKGHFPLFFYGQSYLAPFESYLVAPFFFLFGKNPISLQIVPVLLMLICGIVIFYLGKEVKDANTGLWAAILFLFPPLALFLKGFKSQGYIPEYLLFGTLILLLTFKITNNYNNKRKQLIYYLLLGIISGIGFWITYSTIHFILIAGLFLLLNFKKSNLIKYSFLSIASFFLVGLPYWIFSFKDNWGNFYFGKVTQYSFAAITNKFFVIDLRKLLTTGLNNIMTILILSIYIIVFIFFVIHSLKKSGKKLWSLWWLPFVVFLFYINPKIYRLAIVADTRYVVGVYLSLALIAGYTTAWLNRKNKYYGTTIAFLLIAVNLYACIAAIPDYQQQSIENRNKFSKLENILIKNKIDRIMVPGRELRDLAFITNEEFVFAKYHGGDYIGNRDILEQSQEIAYYFKNRDSSFMALCPEFNNIDDFYFGFKRYPYKFKEIEPSKWTITSNYTNDDCPFAIDRNYSTLWSSVTGKRNNMYFLIDLGKEYPVSKIQVFYGDRYFGLPENIRIYLSNDASKWQEVLAVNGVDSFFWSGPRLYYLLVNGRYEFIFKPQNSRYIKIVQDGTKSPYPWDINELFIYEYAGNDSTGWDKDQLFMAYQFLKEKEVNFIYTDFWESAKIKEWGGIETIGLFDKTNDKRYVALSKNNGFILNESDKEEWENVSKDLDINLSSKEFGPYWCYFFDELTPEQRQLLKEITSLYWLGTTGVKINLYDYSDLLYKTGLEFEKKNQFKKALSLHKKALTLFPRYMPYKRLKEMNIDVSLWQEYFEPQTTKHITFENGLVFLGTTIEKSPIKRGERISLDYFWGVKKESDPIPAVFVHFKKDGKTIFQGDYLLRLPHPYSKANPHDIVRYRYHLNVPSNIESGTYKITAGLWLPDKNKRIREANSKRTEFDIGSIKIER